MSYKTSRQSWSLATKSVELAIAAPLVVAHRVARMASAGHKLSARDRKEFTRMVAEKNTAFFQSWQAMAMHVVLANQAIAASVFRSFWSLSPRKKPASAKLAAQVQSAALGVLDKGLSPVHRKAVANARRLARTKIR